ERATHARRTEELEAEHLDLAFAPARRIHTQRIQVRRVEQERVVEHRVGEDVREAGRRESDAGERLDEVARGIALHTLPAAFNDVEVLIREAGIVAELLKAAPHLAARQPRTSESLEQLLVGEAA